MEQKRTLWIVAAAGIFLLVVVGAALIIFRPVSSGYPVETGFVSSAIQTSVDSPSTAASPFDNSQTFNLQQTPFLSGAATPVTDPVSNDALSAKSDSAAAAPNELHSENLTVYANNTTVYEQGQITYNFDLNKMMAKNQDAVTTSVEYSSPAQSVSSTVSKEEAKSKPVTDDSYYTPAPKKAESKKTAAESKPAAKTQTKSAAVKTEKTASKTPAKTAKPASPKTPDRFWIQAASYTNKEGADNARKILEANKMNNEVFTYTDSKGKLFYRVRIGPYTTSSEAEYWQKRLAVIDQFSSTPSYIVNSSAKK